MSIIATGTNTVPQIPAVPTSFFISSTFVSPAPVTTTSPVPTGGVDGVNSTGSTLGSSASLYLYTFLATLVLLLGVSSAIVLRSLFIRRRQRRLMEEAIRNGTWIPPISGRKVDLADKPVMHEVWAQIGRHGKEDEKEEWEGLQPFFSVYTKPPASHTTPMTELPQPPPRTAASRITARFPSRLRRALLSSPPAPTPSLAPSPTSAPPHTPTPPTLSLAELDRHLPRQPASVRYAVLIAMPAPPRPHPPLNPEGGTAEEELPHIEFGVSEAEVKEPEEPEEEKGEPSRKQSGETD